MTLILVRGLARIFLIVVACGWALPCAAAKPKMPAISVKVGALPAWVKPVEPAFTSGAPEGGRGGVSYLLIDRQENLEAKASYYHEVLQITGEEGIREGSTITALFDPSFHRVFFHSIRVTRQGVAANRLEQSRIEVFPRERDLEKSVYDRTYVARYDLEDLRPDDVIEFAYTVVGANPAKGGKYKGLSRAMERPRAAECASFSLCDGTKSGISRHHSAAHAGH